MSSKYIASAGLHNRKNTVPLDPPTSSCGQTESVSLDDDRAELLSVSWNQDFRFFSAGTSKGFRIYECEPLREIFRRTFQSGGFGIVEMLFRSNIMALVGSMTNSQCPPNKVILWDDYQNQFINEFAFRSKVKAVKLGRDNLVIILEHRIYVHNVRDLKLIYQLETLANPRGLCCLSHDSNTSVLACPGIRQGQVRVEHFGLKMTKLIAAHDSHVACMALTKDGFLLATASMKGTLIRIYNTMDGTRLQEVRRGVDRADIYSISLSPDVQWLAVSSNKGTVHVFKLRVRISGEGPTDLHGAYESSQTVNQHSSTSPNALLAYSYSVADSLSYIRGALQKCFNTELSFAQLQLPDVSFYTTAFGARNTVMIIGMDGSFRQCSFDPLKGGEMIQDSYTMFIQEERNRLAA